MIEEIAQSFAEAKELHQLVAKGQRLDEERIRRCREKIEEARRLLQSLEKAK
jgi:hypothetical protein